MYFNTYIHDKYRKVSILERKKLCDCSGGKVVMAADLVTVEREYKSLEDWVNDDMGYFLIRIDRENGILEAGFCAKPNVVSVLFRGKKPEDIYFEIGRMKFCSRHDHSSYLGSELCKAYLALKNNLAYVQDEALRLDKPYVPDEEKDK